jgi:DNA-nicking Smr family endonuclease
MKRSDGLGINDAALWEKVTRQTAPLPKAQRAHQRILEAGKMPMATKPATPPKTAQKAMPPKPHGQPTRPIAGNADAVSPQVDIHHKARRRLGRGRLEIDARLDLHGMTAAQAKAALMGFIAHCAAQNMTWVLVITGKGVAGQGVLRRELPLWCAQPPLAQQIVEFGPAGPAHGGGGATYMRLRKIRG